MPSRLILPSAIGLSDEQDAQTVEEYAAGLGEFMEIGQTGLKRASGYVDEEFLPQLKGNKAIQVFREMGDNEPLIGGLMYAIFQLIRNTEFPVVPAGKNREDNEAAKLVETARDDMSHSWADMLGEILTCLQYGWSYHEIVYKRCNGPWERDGKYRSKYSDGLVRWRRIPIRSQDTLLRWVFDDTGGIQAMIQLPPPDYQLRVLPIERSLLFRFGVHKGNPQGRSMLRNAYRPWFYKKRLEEFESIGVERDLAGLPMVKVPARYLRAKQGTAEQKTLAAMTKMIRSLRRNEQEGVIFPRSVNEETKQDEFEFELLGSGGTRQFQTNEIIERYKQEMLMSALADFMLVGHEETGTYNMHLDKTQLFRTALNGTVHAIADVFNRHAIPRLFLKNGWKPSRLPKFQPEDVDAPNLEQLVSFLTGTSQLGFTWGPDADMERFLRSAAGLPQLGEDDYTKKRKEARRAEATRFAQVEIEYLASRSQLAQAIAQEKMHVAGEPTPEEQGMMQQQQQAQEQAEQGKVTAQQQSESHALQMTSGTIQQAQQLRELMSPSSSAKALPAGKGGSRGNR